MYFVELLCRMGSDSSTTERAEESVPKGGTSIGLKLPIRVSGLFKHSASEHVLNFLSDNPDFNVSIPRAPRYTVRVCEHMGQPSTAKRN